AREGKYRRLCLPERVGPHAPPTMMVVDMRRHLREGQASVMSEHLISPPLKEAIEKRLAAGEQTVLLLNRRGFANHVLCLKCETAVMCPHCDVSMTYHKTMDRLLCHWCGHKMPVPQVCPNCGAAEIHILGLGTQKIEENLRELFPAARLLRVDMDSMRRRGAYQEAWRKIQGREVDIILGTQMIAKGLHLEAVTLVGVISADFALFLPDFRAAERTYALLTQVAGRAGRGAVVGEVIVQTFIPHHYAIDTAARRAEAQFYERELHIRGLMRFPPFARLAALLLAGPDGAAVADQAQRLANMLKALAARPAFKTVQILGATPAPLARLDDQYRWRILARGQHVRPLQDLLRQGIAEFEQRVKKSGAVSLTIDIDPMDLL
ncbi:MAG: primosomal protein N', partial [bacterium]|nr:primosomal protein N' [bacterium]